MFTLFVALNEVTPGQRHTLEEGLGLRVGREHEADSEFPKHLREKRREGERVQQHPRSMTPYGVGRYPLE